MLRSKDKKPSGGFEQAERKRTTVYLPTPLYKALKIYAVQNDKEMSEVVVEGLRKLGLEG